MIGGIIGAVLLIGSLFLPFVKVEIGGVVVKSYAAWDFTSEETAAPFEANSAPYIAFIGGFLALVGALARLVRSSKKYFGVLFLGYLVFGAFFMFSMGELFGWFHRAEMWRETLNVPIEGSLNVIGTGMGAVVGTLGGILTGGGSILAGILALIDKIRSPS